MQLEEYFDFLAPDDIRIRGTRIGIESVLLEYLHNARTPEEIAARFRTVTLEQVYATILYYLHDQERVKAYLTDYLEWRKRSAITRGIILPLPLDGLPRFGPRSILTLQIKGM
jgi:uncharacterized protein (DUF433 family)